MRNARAAYLEQLRNQALAEDPALAADPEALQARVRELLSEVRRAAARRGGAATRARFLAARTFEANRLALLEQAELLVQMIRESGDPHAQCDHAWPDDLGVAAFCQRCGMPYADYSQKEVAA